jgi:hypothetical protein
VVIAVETTKASRPTRRAAAEVIPSTHRWAAVSVCALVAVALIEPLFQHGCGVIEMDTARRPEWYVKRLPSWRNSSTKAL